MTFGPSHRKTQPQRRNGLIASCDALAGEMRGGRTLVKTNFSRGPSYEVGGKLCDPAIAQEAIARGLVCPLDSELFGPAFAQCWHLKERSDDNT